MTSKIHIIVTGGTFDKDYDPIKGLLAFKQSHLDQIIEQVNLTVPYEAEILLLKDSLDFDDNDREQLNKAILNSPHQKIVVIHGTDTMQQNANNLAACQKTVVFTGAMRPWALSHSDAEFNLGMAIALVQTLEQGVFITMHGQYWPADKVQKNRTIGRFQSL